jgi:hypothetical protein
LPDIYARSRTPEIKAGAWRNNISRYNCKDLAAGIHGEELTFGSGFNADDGDCSCSCHPAWSAWELAEGLF